MFDKMKQLMEMKKQVDKIKKNLDSSDIDVNEVSGISIKINGSQNFVSISIDEEYLRPEAKRRLERDLLRSVNAAIRKSQGIAAEKMREVMPSIPGLGGF